ncbi:MAG: hypothetical protein IJ097_00365 [Bacilli bacterium]|nr:hypothetical protein [Bacilli bacterium]
MNKIPKLFKNENINPIDHNKKQAYVKENTNKKTIIRTKTKTIETDIVYRNNKYITTIDKQIIPIQDIIYIKEK